MKKAFLLLFIASLALPISVYLAQQRPIKEIRAVGNTYYVPDNFSSIQAAVNAAQPGDTIYVRSGTYNESVRFNTSGQKGNPITLTNYSNEEVTINGGGNPAIVDYNGTEYWIIEGFTLDSNAEQTVSFDAWGCGGTCGGTHHWVIRDNTIIGAVRIYGSYNLFEGNEVDGSQHKGSEDGVWELYDASHHNAYRNNHIHHFNSRGIWSMHRTHDSIFENNYVHHIQYQQYSMCIDTDGFGTVEWRHTIRGNHLHDCGQAGIEMENTFDSLVENNIIHNTGAHGIIVINYGATLGPGDDKCEVGGENNQYGDTDGDNDCEGDITDNILRQNIIYNGGWSGVSLYHAGGVKIWGNTIYNHDGLGIVLQDCGVEFCPEIEIRGNIIAENDDGEIDVDDAASLVVDDHNLLYHTGAGKVYRIVWEYFSLSEYQSMTGKGQGSVEASPLFVDPINHDFHLQADSTAVDAGIDIGLNIDLNGNPRPQGAGYDIGVYEYSEGPVFNLSSGWNQISWPDVSGYQASDIPAECPIVVVKENFWFKPYVKNFGGVNFNFEKGKTYYIKCDQSVIWSL